MGLDAVELVMDVEERFGVALEPSDLRGVVTVADLAAAVVSRLPRASGACPGAKAFYALRRLLAEHAGVERRRVRPRARLEELIPPRRRHRVWKRLRADHRGVPPLTMFRWQDRAMLWITALTVVACVPVLVLMGQRYGLLVAGPSVGAVFGVGIAVRLAADGVLRHQIPEGLDTVGDLARAAAPIEIPESRPGHRLLVEMRVLEEVRRLTAECLCVPPEEVRAESEFVKDLGAQ